MVINLNFLSITNCFSANRKLKFTIDHLFVRFVINERSFLILKHNKIFLLKYLDKTSKFEKFHLK